MKIERVFTEAGKDAYDSISFTRTQSEIRNPDGTIVFKLDNVEVPEDWSQVASDVIAQKYFRKAGVPVATRAVAEDNVPEFLWRHAPDQAALEKLPKDQRFTGETSAKQVFDRLADFTESQVRLRAKLMGALMYPIIMAGLALAIVTYFPLFKALTWAANPALALTSTKVVPSFR